MTLIEQLKGIITAELPDALEFDPTATPMDNAHMVQFTLRLDSGEERVDYYIRRGNNLEGRKGITRVEMRFQRETGIPVYVKLLNGK